MNKTEEFLSYLDDLDIKVWIDGISGSSRDVSLRCNAPKGTLIPDIRAELGERKDEIIAFLRKTNLASTLTLEPIRPISRNGTIPLSFNQQRLWFVHQIEEGSTTYNEFFAVSIKGLLQISHLEQSLQEIIQRHEVLRTTFPSKDGYPIQAIAPTLAITLPVVDLQALPKVEQSALIQQLSQQQVQRPFDLVIGPLLRVTLLQLEKEFYVLLLCLHHIVSDGWSVGVFIQELSTLYQASCAGVPSPLPKLPIQYADFAVWQRQCLSGEVIETQLNYWRSQLQDAPFLLELPTDHPRPSVQTYRGATQSFTLNTDLTHQLQTLSLKSGTTLFMTLQMAFTTLLYRYSGQSDILVGTSIANRNHNEIESLIGFFVNTLVLRTRFEDHLSVESLLAQVRETTLKAYEHQDVPFEQVVAALRPQRSLSYSPLYQAGFVLQNIPMPRLELPGLTITPLNLNSQTSRCDLLLLMTQTEKGLESEWQYNTDLFDDTTIVRMTKHLHNLLEGIIANPQAKVRELPLIKESEKQNFTIKSIEKLKQIKRNSIKIEKSLNNERTESTIKNV